MKATLCDSCGQPAAPTDQNFERYLKAVESRQEHHNTFKVRVYLDVRAVRSFPDEDKLPHVDLCNECFAQLLRWVADDVATVRKPKVEL